MGPCPEPQVCINQSRDLASLERQAIRQGGGGGVGPSDSALAILCVRGGEGGRGGGGNATMTRAKAESENPTGDLTKIESQVGPKKTCLQLVGMFGVQDVD